MTQAESRLQLKIQAALRKSGAFVFKVHGSEYMMSGLPDLIVCYKGLYIGLEVKMPAGRVSPIQMLREKQIREAGGICHVVRSVDDAMGILSMVDKRIERVMSEISHDKARPTQSETG